MATPNSVSNKAYETAGISASQRKCVGSGQVTDKSGLIRFVASPDGLLVADLNEKLGGRGVWACANRHCLVKAVAEKKFARHLKQAVSVSDDFLDQLEKRLAEHLISRLSMMRKAGLLVTGGGKLRSGQAEIAGLLIGDDASPREARQLTGVCQPDWVEADIPSVWLGRISGSLSVAYAGVMKSTAPSHLRMEQLLRVDLMRWRGVANAENTT